MGTNRTAAVAAITGILLVNGCSSTGWREVDWRGRPLGDLVAKLGEPTRVLEVSPALSLQLWAGAHRGPDRPPDLGPAYRAVFFVRGDGTVVGAPQNCWCGTTAAASDVIALLGPPSEEVRSKSGHALLTWEAEPGGVSRRLTLGVTPAGFVEFWN
jgi:hypothetical protein